MNLERNCGENIWEAYGFRGNPFDTKALSVQPGGSLPIKDAFVGSQTTEEMRLLNKILSSSGGARLVVEGPVGVGKTTFVNFHRYLWEYEPHGKKLFSASTEIAIYGSWSVKDFLCNILAHLINKLLITFGEAKICQNKLFEELILLNRVYIARSLQIEGSVLGFGGGFGRSTQMNVPPISEAQLVFYLQNLIAEILRLGYSGVILHFDNLELLNRQELKQSLTIFEEIRDILQLDQVFFIFVAQPGFFRKIISPLERVRSIFLGWPIQIAPLTIQETVEVINRRYRLLAIDANKIILPVEDELIACLYQLYEGKIRFIMDAIASIIYHLPTCTIHTLPSSSAIEILKNLALEKIRRVLTPRELEILRFASQLPIFTNSELAKQSHIDSRNIAKYLQRLLDLHYISLAKKEGRNVFYRIAEDARIIGYEGIPKPPAAHPQTNSETKPPVLAKPLKDRQRRLLLLLARQPQITVRQWATDAKIGLATARQDLQSLEQLDYIAKIGCGRATCYASKDGTIAVE